jgi:hypothetical protein
VEASHYVCRPVSSLLKIARAPLPCPFSGTFGILLDRMLEQGIGRPASVNPDGMVKVPPA